MHRLPAVFAAILLAVHSVFGCCGHHAHECPSESQQFAALAGHTAATAQSGCKVQRDSCEEPEHQHPGQDRCEAWACVFIAKNCDELGKLLSGADAALDVPAGPWILQLSGVGFVQPTFPGSVFSPSLRRHLLNQVLLI